MPLSNPQTFSPGQRLLIRDAEWLVRRVDVTESGTAALSVSGISEIVRGKEAVFLSAAEEQIEILDPVTTKLVGDPSSGFLRTRLYLESQLRRTPPIGSDLFIGHRAAMDLLPFQLEPAAQALAQPRQRILIADTVGLGKTLEAGILVAELIRRGRARRILVVTQKSLLSQFQKEFWTRFTIPLVRLDSIGLQRVRNQLPTHANPFYYYDRSIISIDTLKQDNEFRHHLEQAYWDVIIIDEAHNVAKRGSSAQRHRLAELLATRSDTLIMLSATPHDGRKASFASLMNMLDPTAIADPENYTKEDIKGLHVRRFRNEVIDQLRSGVPERKMIELRATGSGQEEAVFELLDKFELSTEIGERKKATGLFRTTLLKGFLSCPNACKETISNRIKNIDAGRVHGTDEDKSKLGELLGALSLIDEVSFSKYQLLLKYLKSWKPAADDRLVIFTERIATLDYLQERLPKALGLKINQVTRLDGSSMDDVELMEAVDAFGQEDSPVRLLLASDVASEGINLHYQCHRLIHFDVPWSLMVFAQRNGRIDRYGQKHQPELAYLITCSSIIKRTDERVLQLLLEKDKQAQESIGDPSVLLGKYTIEEQEKQVEEALETGNTKELDRGFGELDFDPFELFLKPDKKSDGVKTCTMPTLFDNEYVYCSSALHFLRDLGEPLQFQTDNRKQELFLTIHKDADSDDLSSRFHFLPTEILPDKGQLHLTINSRLVQEAMEKARKEGVWPQTQYLWPLHPVLEWVDDRVQATFGRHEAPVVFVPGLRPNEALVLISGVIPNRLGHPLVLRWIGVQFRDGKCIKTLGIDEALELCGLRSEDLVNQNPPTPERCTALQPLLVPALAEAKVLFEKVRKETLERNSAQLDEQERRLDVLLARHAAQIELAFVGGIEQVNAARKEDRRHQVLRAFEAHKHWLRDAHNIEEHAHFTILAVCTGA